MNQNKNEEQPMEIDQGNDTEVQLKANEDYFKWIILKQKLQALRSASDNNSPELIISLLKELVIGYKPEKSIADSVFVEQKK